MNMYRLRTRNKFFRFFTRDARREHYKVVRRGSRTLAATLRRSLGSQAVLRKQREAFRETQTGTGDKS